MEWSVIVERVTPYIVKVETPTGHGTGFLCFYNQSKTLAGIATARHVVDYADEWKQPIKLVHVHSSTDAFLGESDRVVLPDANTDSALILIQYDKLDLPGELIGLLPSDTPLAIGAEVGWLGFPANAQPALCFFAGIISARQERRHAYFIDGVAISGVSGGPVVSANEADEGQIVGTISAYISNKTAGDTLPGLSVARDVSHFHDIIDAMHSMDEARAEREQKKKVQETQNVEQPQDQEAEAPPPEDKKSPGN